MTQWLNETVFYHIYPMGFCNAPERNDFHSEPVFRLDKVAEWADHIRDLGCNALYLGPIFESTAHGYDTADYYKIDRRLGDNESFKALCQKLHSKGIRIVLDGVFNHTGRDFWAFRDLQQNRQNSPYQYWYKGIDFGRQSPSGDSFWYEGWNGFYDLAKLNLQHPDVKKHLFDAVGMWIREFGIDGLRLDAADCIEASFFAELQAFCRSIKPDFWLMGEVIHGDYRRWAGPGMLDSVTNYEVYKGLWSSHNDANYFEIAYAFNRQSGEGGMYKNLLLYNFADNHDVDRVASSIKDPKNLFPLYTLLYTMPGIPSVYYGSEWGMQGKRTNGSDTMLRPNLNLAECRANPQIADLPAHIQKLATIRQNAPSLKAGNYKQAYLQLQQFAFSRQKDGDVTLVAVNSDDKPIEITVDAPIDNGTLYDALNPGETVEVIGRKAKITIYPHWGRILRS